MQLTDVQEASVRQWVADGASLSEIQTNLAEEYDLRLSYMDVRLLVLDLDLSLRERQVEKKPEKPEAAAEEPEDAPGAEKPLGGVRVEVSRIAQPGFALTGDVTFSDGVTAQWGITTRGELSLTASVEGYRPSDEDLQDFQLELRRVIGG